MKNAIGVAALFVFWSFVAIAAHGQDPPGEERVQGQAEPIVAGVREEVEEIAEKVDQSAAAQEASAGILKPIYALAEQLSFPAFYWIAFALLVVGVVSFALQLVLAKLVVLSKLGFSFTEVLSDALGLAISLVGLVLTTQAATENSNFPASPAAVISATAVGVILGIVFYWWGQSQELRAVEGRKQQASKRAESQSKLVGWPKVRTTPPGR